MIARMERNLSDLANHLSAPVQGIISASVKMALPLVQAAFKARLASLSEWASLPAAGPAFMLPIDPDVPPALPIPEGTPLPNIPTHDPVVGPRSTHTVGGVWKPSLQTFTKLSADAVSESLIGVADHIADGVEEALVEALEDATFQTAQRQAAALSATALAAAMQQHAVLRTPGGGLGPPPATLLCAADAAVTYAAIFPRPIPGLAISVSRQLPSGRWYLLPQVRRSPLSFPVLAGDLSIDDRNFSIGASMRYEVRMYTICAAAPYVYLAADNSPRWTIKGGV